MRSLSHSSSEQPAALSTEKPAKNLASLVTNDSLSVLSSSLLEQWQKRELFADVERHGIRPIDRVLFYGPPGNGKTMSAQVVASSLDCPLYRVCCESLLGQYLGGTQKNMAEVLDWLEQQDRAVVLWDECETIFPSRQWVDGQSSSEARVSAMQVFWQRLDRWESPQIFLLATNLRERIDPALLSRCELQIEFGPPTAEQALKVLEYWMEVFHQHGADQWGARIAAQVAGGGMPESFRQLWQWISQSVRESIVSGTKGKR